MVIFGLLLLKSFLYYGVMMLAPVYLGVAPVDRFVFSIAWAAARIVLGLLVGYLAFLAVAFLQGQSLPFAVAYAIVLLPVRFGLWWFTSRLILVRHSKQGESRVLKWLLVGVCASFLVDAVALLAGADNFKYIC